MSIKFAIEINTQKECLDNDSVDYAFLRKRHKELLRLLREREKYVYSGDLDEEKANTMFSLLRNKIEHEYNFNEIIKIDKDIDFLQKKIRKLEINNTRKAWLKKDLINLAQSLGKQIGIILYHDYSKEQKQRMPEGSNFLQEGIKGASSVSSRFASLSLSEARKIQKKFITAMEEEDIRNGIHTSNAREINAIYHSQSLIDSEIDDFHDKIPFIDAIYIDKKIDNFINIETSSNQQVIEHKKRDIQNLTQHFSKFLYKYFIDYCGEKNKSILEALNIKKRSYELDFEKERELQKNVLNIIREKYIADFGSDSINAEIIRDLNNIKELEIHKFKPIYISKALDSVDKFIAKHIDVDIFKYDKYKEILDSIMRIYEKINKNISNNNNIEQIGDDREGEMVKSIYEDLIKDDLNNFPEYIRRRKLQKILLHYFDYGRLDLNP